MYKHCYKCLTFIFSCCKLLFMIYKLWADLAQKVHNNSAFKNRVSASNIVFRTPPPLGFYNRIILLKTYNSLLIFHSQKNRVLRTFIAYNTHTQGVSHGRN